MVWPASESPFSAPGAGANSSCGYTADEVTYLGALEFDTLCDLPWAERKITGDPKRRESGEHAG